MVVVAVDPGNTHTAIVVYDLDRGAPLWFAKLENADARMLLLNPERFAIGSDYAHACRVGKVPMAIEMIASYGMPVGAEVFETCVWIGRFIEAWAGPHDLVYRREVKLELCGNVRAKDGNVRQALIDRWGGKDAAIGKKATPGPLYGMSADVWAALGVAVTWAARHEAKAA